MTEMSRENALAHFGVKGMKWGVRNEKTKSELKGLGPDKIVRTLSNGDTLTLERNPANFFIKSMGKISENYRKAYNDAAYLNIKDSKGKTVGNAQIWKKSDEELYLNWITIKGSERGQGYATSALKAAEEFGAKQGFKKMTLEVPGNSPDARHIYERLGFKVVKEEIDPDDPVWGGLTSMEYNFETKRR